MEKEVVWTETALNQLEKIYFYLLETTKSETISERTVEAIYNSVAILKTS
jgi:plasmid stabilization system protein ParE